MVIHLLSPFEVSAEVGRDCGDTQLERLDHRHDHWYSHPRSQSVIQYGAWIGEPVDSGEGPQFWKALLSVTYPPPTFGTVPVYPLWSKDTLCFCLVSCWLLLSMLLPSFIVIPSPQWTHVLGEHWVLEEHWEKLLMFSHCSLSVLSWHFASTGISSVVLYCYRML